MTLLPMKMPEINFDKEIAKLKLEELEQSIRKHTFKKGTIISKPGDRGNVYIVNSGRVELYEIAENGKKFIYSVLKRGRIFGDFDLNIAPIFCAEVIDEAVISVMKTKVFMELLLKEPQLLLKIFKYFFIRLLVVQKKAASIATDDVMSRLVKLLIQLGRPIEVSLEGQYMTDKYTHEQLSQMLGVSRQTITTTISELQKKGLLKRKKKTFVFDKEKLLKMAA